MRPGMTEDRRLTRSALALAVAALPGAAAAATHLYSYDPASDAARTLAPSGLSIAFDKPAFGSPRVTRVIQTGDRGEAALKPAPESALGDGGLRAVLGPERPRGRLYEITAEGDGPAFVRAVCPGAARAWLVVSPPERFEDLTIQAIGRDEGAAAARPCVTLELRFRSEWTLPPRAPPRVRNSPRGLS